ncbi:hypothetical protein SLEP1_g1807 [Rubroshorea leprosula]|uniref:Peptidase A1 domain-containing protein n=1 Tax=Rubroshorea leprosula TaxID=152421 RepID=A0AAV5HKX9_9ROSI|nr:hypothetical protein SLEP1_g1807 [Rubroshorea leprosula]
MLVHRYGPCSPLAPSKYVTDAQGKETHQLPIPDKGLIFGGGNYVVKLGFGTPIRNFYLTVDTGSDITWIRCKPCSSCLGGPKTTIFDPKSSSTFRKSYCSSSDCSKSIEYLILPMLKDIGHPIPSQYRPLTRSKILILSVLTIPTLQTSGLLAFGHSDDNSLVTRTSNVFCHCFPSEDATGYLLFGPEARVKCQVGNLTPLISNPPKDVGIYFVNFVGISVVNKTLKITSSSTGTMIDSGTVITRLTGQSINNSPLFSVNTWRNTVLLEPMAVKSWTRVMKTGYKCDTVKFPTGTKLRAVYPSLVNHQLQKLNVLYDIQRSKVGIGAGNYGQ